MHTPNDIEILIHYYVTKEPHPRIGAEAVNDTLKNFVKEGIFNFDLGKGRYSLTNKGETWMRMILSVPLPEEERRA